MLKGLRHLSCTAQVEGITIDEEGLALLGDISERTSLRHAVQVGTRPIAACLRQRECGIQAAFATSRSAACSVHVCKHEHLEA